MEIGRIHRTIRDKEPSGEQHFFTQEAAGAARAFHKTLPGYAPTPLVRLDAQAERLGLGGLFVKDESFRFGLNAFKALGGSYCIAKILSKRWGLAGENPSYISLKKTADSGAERVTFVTATDGNHGRGVAWTAGLFGQKAVVYLPKGSRPERVRNIGVLGAETHVTDFNYNGSVRFAAHQAGIHGWELVQDTDLVTYKREPRWIMQGYTTMAEEIREALGSTRITHLLLQAGVGSMAAAMAAYVRNAFPDPKPRICIVEASAADCLYRTAEKGDGSLVEIRGKMPTMMAGLACGLPCGIAWDILCSCAEDFFSVPDETAAEGMRLLARPLGTDPAIVSGESGAVTAGLLAELMTNPAFAADRDIMSLGKDSVVCCISTEGDTDPENYRKVLAED
jgi:diaminopropionate ammonia-lyase